MHSLREEAFFCKKRLWAQGLSRFIPFFFLFFFFVITAVELARTKSGVHQNCKQTINLIAINWIMRLSTKNEEEKIGLHCTTIKQLEYLDLAVEFAFSSINSKMPEKIRYYSFRYRSSRSIPYYQRR